jgi:hypothetical protein
MYYSISNDYYGDLTRSYLAECIILDIILKGVIFLSLIHLSKDGE